MPNYSISSQIVDPGHPFTITLIGAGGTGSQVLTHLARMHKSLLAMKKMGLHVTLWDGDKVTEANMGRQLFTKHDIGQYKSTVLIERINRFFGMYWEAQPEHLKETSVISSKMIISCVDNVETRRIIEQHYSSNRRARLHYHADFWLDTGNGLNSGQIVLGCKALKLPHILEVHPNMEKFEDANNVPSCSVAEALGKQDIFINSAIALETGKLVWDIVYHKQLKWSRSYINFDRQACVVRNKLIIDEPNQIQVQSGRTRKAAHKRSQEDGKGSKAAAGRRGVRRPAKSRRSGSGKVQKSILRHGKRAGKVRGGKEGRVSQTAGRKRANRNDHGSRKRKAKV